MLQPVVVPGIPQLDGEDGKNSEDETSDDETSNDETSNDETSNDETSNDETSNDETSNDETSDDEQPQPPCCKYLQAPSVKEKEKNFDKL